MNLIIIFGPHAVGKMTVGQSLSSLTGIPLFHNHESIELALRLLPDDQHAWSSLSNEIREVVFKHVSKSHQKGLIFTFMWALDEQNDHRYIDQLEKLFTQEGFHVYYVELCADRNIRLERNTSENRLKYKPSKRNLIESEHRFIHLEAKYRLNTFDGEITKKNYIKIDNTHLSPGEVAHKIKDTFHL